MEERSPSMVSFGEIQVIHIYRPESLKVQFDQVEINEFSLILGDNPAVSEGVPLALAPKADNNAAANTMSVDTFEKFRAKNRRRGQELVLSPDEREDIMLGCGYSAEALLDVEKTCRKIRASREASMENIAWDGFHAKLEVTKRSFRKMVHATGDANSNKQGRRSSSETKARRGSQTKEQKQARRDGEKQELSPSSSGGPRRRLSFGMRQLSFRKNKRSSSCSKLSLPEKDELTTSTATVSTVSLSTGSLSAFSTASDELSTTSFTHHQHTTTQDVGTTTIVEC